MTNHRPKNNNTVPLWGFLEFLKTEGFEINTGQYLNIYRLLDRMDFNTTPFDDLKYIIAPLVSKTPEDQEKFYSVFDTYFVVITKKTETSKKTPKKNSSNEVDRKRTELKSKKRKKFALTLFLAFVLLVGLGVCYTYLIKPMINTEGSGQTDIVVSERNYINTLFTELLESPDLKKNIKVTIKTAQINFNNNDTFSSASSIYNVRVSENINDIDFQKLTTLQYRLDQYDNKFNQRYNRSINIVWPDVEIYLSLILIISFLLYEYYKSQNQSFIAELEQGKKPPYVWQFNLKHKPKIVWDSEIYQAAHHLRKRVIGEELDFDVDGTIKETLNHGGLLEFSYKRRSKPSEYIVWIDKSSVQSHQSSFFSFLVNEFSQNDIHIEQFFYQESMLVFWNESDGKKHYSLEDLIKLFPKHRVLIFGCAHELLDARSGSIKKYAQAMNAWSDIAILTPRQTIDWDYKEKILSYHFNVLPATSSGLIELVDTFEGIKSTQLGAWKFDHSSSGFEIPEDAVLGVKHLSYQMSNQVFKWLCICAVYPQLFWDLTLYLGDVMFKGKSIITQENIAALLKLSWFNTGFIPLDYRQELMARLDQTTLDEVRRQVVDQMRKNPPKKNTHAYDEYKLNLLVNELLIKDLPNRQKKAIRREIKNMESHVDFDHYTEIKAINPRKNTSALDFILPEEIQNIFKGTSWKPILARTLLFLFMSFIGVYFLSDYIYKVIKDDNLFATVGVVIASIIYGFAFYRFLRKRSLLNSVEVAFYWLFLSIAYVIIFVNTKTVILKVFNSANLETDSIINFAFLFLILTIPLILKQIKKGIKGEAVAIYYFSLSILLIFGIEISLHEIITELSANERISYAFAAVFLVSIVFWVMRFKKRKNVNKVEIGIYYSVFFLFAMLFTIDTRDNAMVFIMGIFIILLGLVARKWKSIQFLTDSSFAVFWISINLSAMMIAESYKMTILILITLLMTIVIYIHKAIKSKTLEYESSIYSILILVTTMFYLFEIDQDKVALLVTSSLSLILLFIIFVVRKYTIHTIELLCYWFGLMLLSIIISEEFDLNTLPIVLVNAATAIIFILYKIKSHKKLREAYNLDM